MKETKQGRMEEEANQPATPDDGTRQGCRRHTIDKCRLSYGQHTLEQTRTFSQVLHDQRTSISRSEQWHAIIGHLAHKLVVNDDVPAAQSAMRYDSRVMEIFHTLRAHNNQLLYCIVHRLSGIRKHIHISCRNSIFRRHDVD